MATTSRTKATKAATALAAMPRRRKEPGMVTETLNTTVGSLHTTLKTVNTTLSVVSKSAEIIDIKLDEIKLEAWADLQETRAETFAQLSAFGMTEEEIKESYAAHGFK